MRYKFNEVPFLGKFFLLGSLIFIGGLIRKPEFAFAGDNNNTISSLKNSHRIDSTATTPVPVKPPQFKNDNFIEKVNWRKD